MSFLRKLTPHWMLKYVDIYKEEGFKATVKAAGWKVILLIIVFYLIRDTILFIIIPWLSVNYFINS